MDSARTTAGPAQTKVRVLSDDAARLDALRKALSSGDGAIEVSGAITDGSDLAVVVDGKPFDLLVVDGATKGSLDALGALCEKRPAISTIVVSDDHSPEFLMQAMRAGVREVLPMESPPEALQAALARVRQIRQNANAAPEARVLAFLSCKGGSGATFLATNVAYAMAAEQRARVALIDLNLQFGDAALYVSDRRPPSNLAEVAQQIQRLDGSLLESSMVEVLPNFWLLAAPGDPAAAAEIDRTHIEAILQVARSRYDVVILDVPRSLDAISLQALDHADQILPVLQLVLPNFRDARRLIDIFRSLDYPRGKTKFIVNRYEKKGQISLEDLESAIGQKVFRTVPNDYTAVTAAVNLGLPLLKTQRNHPISRVLIEIARELAPVAQTDARASGGWLSRVFGSR